MSAVTDRTVLITGGTGSFGHQATAKFLEDGAAEVRIFSRDEYKQSVMRSHFGNEPRVRFYLGDVRDSARISEATEGVEILVHGAAMKQLPACEEHPWEAIRTNVVGTRNVIDAARANGVARAVHLSADKAVLSTSVYGATKQLAEQLFIDANLHGPTLFTNLRYSNVLDSRGSVFELFRDRLAAGSTVTVFDPRMVRAFVTQQRVVDLCLLALERGAGGETFVQVSAPLPIVQLAETMARIIGTGRVEVRDDGGRPGEKLDATLISEEEARRTVRFGDVLVVNNLGRPLDLPGAAPVDETALRIQDLEPIVQDELEHLLREVLGR